MTTWYYADRHNQQQGPLDAATLVAACREGRIDGQTQVWREGLSGWVPLAQVAGELGLVVVPAAPPGPPPAAGRWIAGIAARAPSGSSTSARTATWIIVGAVFFGAIMVLAILAAIALPAYQDYRLRAQVVQAALAGEALQHQVEAWSEHSGTCPRNGEGGIGSAASYAGNGVATIEVGPIDDVDGECGIHVTLGGGERGLAGKYLQWALDADGQWHFASDVRERHLPPRLREARD